MRAMEYLQLDPLQIIARSQDISLYSRVLDYAPEQWEVVTYRQRSSSTEVPGWQSGRWTSWMPGRFPSRGCDDVSAVRPFERRLTMKILVTGSSGHLGEALVRTLRKMDHEVVGTDLLPSEFTDRVGSIADRAHVKQCMPGIEMVLHPATLHKPHVATHSRQSFVDTNITGTLNLLEEAVEAGVRSFVFTSTTSTFGGALTPAPGDPAAWITEEVTPVPKNIYGVTKTAAESLCELFHRNHQLACVVLRTSRFFPEEDDQKDVRRKYEDQNIKVNEFLYRRVDIEDVVSAHLLALEKAPALGFARYIISATTPFTQDDLFELRVDAPGVLKRRIPDYEAVYARLGWKMFPAIDRVYVNERARHELGWQPQHDFQSILERLKTNAEPFSALTRRIGSKGYHALKFTEGPYPVD